ncbi:MAG: putative ABC transporter permease [Lachnotalea sp.]
MFSYNIFQWILFFYIYCVCGWVFETTYVSLKSKRFVNRGFLKGPMIPIYGEGAILMVIITTPIMDNIWFVFIMGMIGATLLEFIVGALMESVFKVKYWDYSNQRFNIKGYVCLSSTVCWGFLSVLLTKVIQLPIESVVLSLKPVTLSAVVAVITIIFMFDAVTSAKEAWDLRSVLLALTKAREEIAIIQRQLEIKKDIFAVQLSDKRIDFVEQLIDKRDEIFEELQARKDVILHSIKGNRGNVIDDEILKNRLDEELTKHQSLVEKLSSTSRWILKRNPGATSNKFYDALEYIKDYVDVKKRKK